MFDRTVSTCPELAAARTPTPFRQGAAFVFLTLDSTYPTGDEQTIDRSRHTTARGGQSIAQLAHAPLLFRAFR
jgi:hypothetical protein